MGDLAAPVSGKLIQSLGDGAVKLKTAGRQGLLLIVEHELELHLVDLDHLDDDHHRHPDEHAEHDLHPADADPFRNEHDAAGYYYCALGRGGAR